MSWWWRGPACRTFSDDEALLCIDTHTHTMNRDLVVPARVLPRAVVRAVVRARCCELYKLCCHRAGVLSQSWRAPGQGAPMTVLLFLQQHGDMSQTGVEQGNQERHCVSVQRDHPGRGRWTGRPYATCLLVSFEEPWFRAKSYNRPRDCSSRTDTGRGARSCIDMPGRRGDRRTRSPAFDCRCFRRPVVKQDDRFLVEGGLLAITVQFCPLCGAARRRACFPTLEGFSTLDATTQHHHLT